MPLPLLSIIIPTHNRPQLLRRAVRNALGQTAADTDASGFGIEVIVADVGLPMVTYRLTSDDEPRVSASLQRRQKNFDLLLQKQQEIFSRCPRQRYADFVFNHAYMLWRTRYPMAALKAFIKAVQIHPVQAIAASPAGQAAALPQ